MSRPSLSSAVAAWVDSDGLARLTLTILFLTTVCCFTYSVGYYEGIHNGGHNGLQPAVEHVHLKGGGSAASEQGVAAALSTLDPTASIMATAGGAETDQSKTRPN
ncbi:hypothetical protein FOA52_011391 [Chlamydomonas sp. UWO 241]|nr:hypothetical protein FOA52_011391 [Chlamydomonas sp. UWO 241]